MFKKTVASVLVASMAFGIAGCDIFGYRKEMGNVDGVIKSYGKALQKLDEEKILGMTTWDEKQIRSN